MRWDRRCSCILGLLLGLAACAAARSDENRASVAVAGTLDESGMPAPAAGDDGLRVHTRNALLALGVQVVQGPFSHPAFVVRSRLIHCDRTDCLGSVAVLLPSGRITFESVVSVLPGEIGELGRAMARVAERRLRPPAPITPAEATDITATGATVRRLGHARFSVDGAPLDLHAVGHAHDPAVDPDVPVETDIALDDTVPPQIDATGRPTATITLYQLDPPLTGCPRVRRASTAAPISAIRQTW